MAFLQSLSLSTPPFPCNLRFFRTKALILSPKVPLKSPSIFLPIFHHSSPKPPPLQATEQDIIRSIGESDSSETNSLPGVRTYENDLARLTLIGAVDFEQALTAAAADGGEAAEEHISSGTPAMVVETVFPGPSDEHSTVSTRLFLPARKVKEKARKLRKTLTAEILSSTSSKNILSMTFRQVIVHQLWNFELVIFRSGSERNMEDLQNPREVPSSFSIISTDERAISVLAEVICLSALENIHSNFMNSSSRRTSNGFLNLIFFNNPKRIESKDSSVILCGLLEGDIISNAEALLETFNSEKANYTPVKVKSRYNWWSSSVFSKLEKIGGHEFTVWTREYVPAYRLQIDADRFKDVKLEGWRRNLENRWEVLLTHSQMIDLGNILDLYYEDLYTLPDKQISCGIETKFTNLSINKSNTSLLKTLSITVASGILLVSFTILGNLYFPRLGNGQKYPQITHSDQQSHGVESVQNRVLESTEMEAFCISIIKRIKDAFGWPGEIIADGGRAWIGEIPTYLGRESEANSSSSSVLKESEDEIKASVQDIASYQVVLSGDGKIVGFEPTSRVAVNQWSANPLANELYGGRKLAPGLLEPSLKFKYSNEVVVLELLMSVNADSSFALARPIQL